MPSYNKTIYLNEGELTEVDLATLYPFNNIAVTSTLPAWFVDNINISGYSSFWEITPPLNGTYTYNANVYSSDEPTLVGTAVITLIVEDSYTNIDNCCSDENTNIVWFNRQGGWQNYIFNQRFDNAVEVGKASTFINNGVIKYADRGRVYNSKTVYITGLTKTEIDYLDTLRYAIQAYEFTASTSTFTPILLDSVNFNKYNSKENMYEVSLNYKYATQLDIQKQ